MENDEYRERLLLKLDALIGVLVHAITKVEESMTSSEIGITGIPRLEHIRDNLTTTLGICQKARRTLLSQEKKKAPQKPAPGAREYVEMSSIEEFRKFQTLPPIQKKDIPLVNLIDLCDKLQAD